MKTKYWLMKSEPDVFGIEHLKKKKVATWDGVRNFTVRNLMRDDMRVGDRALFYHSSCKDIGVAGEMEIVSEAFPDPLQFDTASQYFDAKSTKTAPRWLAVKVKYIQTFSRLVPLSQLRSEPTLAAMPILERGNRLSITPVSPAQYKKIIALGSTPTA